MTNLEKDKITYEMLGVSLFLNDSLHLSLNAKDRQILIKD